MKGEIMNGEYLFKIAMPAQPQQKSEKKSVVGGAAKGGLAGFGLGFAGAVGAAVRDVKKIPQKALEDPEFLKSKKMKGMQSRSKKLMLGGAAAGALYGGAKRLFGNKEG